MSILYLIRHGETINNSSRRNVPSTYNYEKKCPDPPLNETGISQAHLLGKRLHDYSINAIYSSDLLRAQQTSQIINKYIGRKIISRTALREIDMGELHLRSFEELKEDFPDFYNNWNKHDSDMPYPHGENGSDVLKRTSGVIKEIMHENIGNTAVVTHGGVIRVLVSVFLGMPLKNRFRFVLDNCGITAVRYTANDMFKIICLNDSAHLHNSD